MGICNDNSWWGYAGILCAGWLSGLVYDRLVRWCDGFYSWTAQNWLMNYPEIHNTEIQGTQWKKEPPYLNKCVGLIHVSSSTLLCFFFLKENISSWRSGFGTVGSNLGLPDAGLASYRDMVERVPWNIWIHLRHLKRKASVSKLTVECEL